MRLIDADGLLPMMKYATTDSEIGVFPVKIGFNEITKVIDDAPTVDAVPVIRCKDCKHYKWADNRAFGFPVKRCEWTGFEDVDDDDYCSMAERKTE